MSQQIENKESSANNASRLPLRKRIGPVLKWQPVETTDENYKPTSYPSPQQYPIFSSEDIQSDEGHDTDEDLSRKRKEELKRTEKEDLASNRPVKKLKRGRPPLQRNTPTETPSLPSTPPSLPQTTTTTRPPTDDTNALYCICKRPYDVSKFMIACDKCNEWFHGECIGISEKQSEFIDLYFCDNCSTITGKKTSWKPKCANPACSKPARIGTHQGRLSKYCTDNCGMQVARARIESAESKKRTALGHVDDAQHTYNPLSRCKLSSFADMDDRARLARVKEEKLQAKSIIAMGEHKSTFLKLLTQHQKEDICGFDSRLSWPDAIWEKVHGVIEQPEDNHMLVNANGESINTRVFHICQSSKKCAKHANWQKLKAAELEQERSEQFVILSMLERERQQIKARMKKRREEVDIVEFLQNGTITHYK